MKGTKKKGRGKIVLLLIMITVVTMLLLGTTFAFLTHQVKGRTISNVEAGVLELTYKDKNTINLENAYPISDKKAIETTPYEFTVENTGTIVANYELSLEEGEESNLDARVVKYTIKEEGGTWSSPAYLKDTKGYKLSGLIPIEAKEKKNYALKLWIDEKAGNEVQGKVFQARVVVNAVQSSSDTKDITPPVINLKGSLSVNVEENEVFEDPGVETVTDDKDTLDKNNIEKSYEYYNGEKTVPVDRIDTSQVGVYYITYKIRDNSKNEGIIVRSVNIYRKDTEPPTIRLKGKSIVAVEKEGDYIEEGATASKEGVDLTERIVTVGEVNTKIVKTYYIKYLITDHIGNTASIVRIVNIVNMNLKKEEILLDLTTKKTEKIEVEGENLGQLTYSSNNKSVATIDQNGTVTGKSVGDAVITVTSSNGVKKQIKVTVQKTVNITYQKAIEIASIGKTYDSCIITKGTTCTITLPEIEVKKGYEKEAWYQETTKVGEKRETIEVANHQTLTAKATPKTYTIIYRASSGEGTMNNTITKTGENTTISKNTFEKVGYTFIGWTTKEDGSDDGYNWTNWSGVWKYDNGEYGIKEETLTLYARWRINTYTVSYDYRTNGGSSSSKTSDEVDYNQAVDLSPIAVKEGWTFLGWNTDQNAKSGLSSLTMKTSNITLYAIYKKEARTVTITFNKNGAQSQTDASGNASTATTVTRSCTIKEVYNNETQATTCNVTSPTIVATSITPTVIGYSTAATTHSSSWNHNTSKAVGSNTTYYAQTSKAAITRSITYTKQGNGVTSIGKTSDSCTIAATYNGTTQATSCTVTAPSITVASGYTAVGWNTSSSATSGTAVNAKITLSGNATYYSISYKNAITYTVSFNANKATLNATSKSCTIGAAYNSTAQATSCTITTPTITAPSVTPTVVGFNQSATATTSQVGSNATLTVTSAMNGKTYYAITRKDARTVTITFNKNGAQSQTASNGTASTATTVTRSCTIAATYNGTSQAATCNVTSPTIVASSNTPTIIGYSTAATTHSSSWNHNTSKAVGSNTTYYAQTSKAAKTITITFNKNGAQSQTDASGNASTATTVTRSCTIAATYNGTAQGTTCSITSPKIVGSTNTPTVTGYSTAAGTHSSSWNQTTAKSVSSNATYYAQTTKAAVTRSVTYTKGAGVSAIGKSSDSCSIGATYNGASQGSSCNVVLPSITSLAGYNTGFWSTSNTAGSGTAANTSISLSSNVTYYARALDTTKPVWSLVSTSPSSGTIGPNDTLTITFKGTDTSGSVTSTLAASSITVKAGSTTITPTTKTLSAASNVTNGKQYSLTLKGMKTDGVVSITIAASTLKDGSNNANNATTLTSSVTIKSVTISKGNVKGGSITLGTTKASVGETVSFTTSPSSGFTYQGATVVCEDTNKILIDSNTKSFKTTSNVDCKTPTVWPSWKKDDYHIWWINGSNNTGGIGKFLYDGAQMNIAFDTKQQLKFSCDKYDARGQIATVNTYNVTDYETLNQTVICPTNNSRATLTLYAGIIEQRDTWLHWTWTIKNSITWQDNEYRMVIVDISNYSGNYYVASQLLVRYNTSTCAVETSKFTGKTYDYANTGL